MNDFIKIILIMFFISISLVSAQEIDNDFIVEQNNETGSFSELQINIDSIEDSGNLNLSKWMCNMKCFAGGSK